MKDLRSKVEEDRGIVKQIELLIPGFHGYREREDIRAADSLLRQQLANKMKEINCIFEQCREELGRAMDLMLISDMGNIIKFSRLIENRIRHAEQGYTGISADFRIEEEELNTMYEWDLALLQTIDSIHTMAGELLNSILVDDGTASQKMRILKNTLNEFNSTLNKRMTKIAGLEVT
ncbi:MAG: hypothetical protein M8352_07350 [ANME-2 cluster archaeon]|nr:hypothetical protein [ANME-2 cluster archaeon]MDF1532480.1 hypothetical protein [ANME-2 cluster archaeon]